MQTIRTSPGFGSRPIPQVACGILLFLAITCPAAEIEPAYAGKSLTAWLALANQSDAPAGFSNAVVAMGPKILPRLIYELNPPATTNMIYARGAISACRILGTNAWPAMPALAVRLAQGHSLAAIALAEMGPDAVPFLADTLVTMPPSCAPQYYTANALGSFGAKGRPAVTNLALMVEQSRISWVRAASMRALGSIAGELAVKEPRCPEVLYVKTVLVKGLAATEPWIQLAALDAMGFFKEAGSDFAPLIYRYLLEKQRQGADEDLLKRIKKILDQIDPKGVFRTGTVA